MKAWATIVAGDTVYCRGGTYATTGSQNYGAKAGTAGNMIRILNYPGESPVWDWGGVAPGAQVRCFNFTSVSFVYFRHLRITNLPQSPTQASYNYGWSMNSGDNNNVMDQIEVDHIGGSGIQVGANCNGNLCLNCDSHDNQDPFSPNGAYENSNGFEIAINVATNSNTYRGCRAWWNADDGFDGFMGSGALFFDSCWSFWNGFIPGTFTTAGNGQGFKLGQSPAQFNSVKRTFTRCLAYRNRQMGFDQNLATNTFQAVLYNNTAYLNGNVGFYFGSTAVNQIRNNISFGSTGGGGQAGAIGAQTVQSNNSWSTTAPTYTVTNADFLSVNDAGISGARQANGTLPNLTFLHLAPGSDLIDRGINVGLPFNGTAPDLGAFESGGATPPPTLQAFATATAIACNGGNSTVTVSGSGGVPPYTGTGTFTRAAGSWTFTITDNVGTTATVNITITQPTAITATQSSTAILINGGTSTTTVTATGGTPALQYQRDGGAFQASNVFAGVLAGTHTIIVRDANLCTRTITYTLTQPTALLVSAAATVNPLLCFGNTTTITVTASGGTTPYQYRINGGALQPSNLFTLRGAGTYTLTVQDAGGAITSTTLTITQPTQITISQSSTAILVNGGTSTTTVTATGGTGTKNYSRDGGAFQASNVFTLVPAGTHTITVRDANLCTNTLTYTLTQPSVLSATAAGAVNPLLCFGNTTTITVTATGGTTPYTYNINGGAFQSSNLFTGRGAGTYTLVTHDASGATFTTNLTITQPTQITITESHTAIVVNGGTSTVTVTAGGGTGAKNYAIDGGAFQVSNVFAGVLAGNHVLQVRDANLCINTFVFTITQPTALVVSASAGTIACNAGTTTATVTASGGTPPYQYRVGAGTLQSSNLFTVSAGTFVFTVVDAGGATVSSASITVTQPTATGISINATPSAPATVTVTATGGVGTKNYRLDAGAFQASNVFTAVAAGNHTITVRDANLCTASVTFSVGATLGITAITNSILCNGGTAQITIGATGGTPPYTGPGIYFQGVGTTTYTVTDNAGHVHDTTIVLTQPSAIAASVSTGTILVNGGTTTATVTASGGVGTLTYSLDGGSFQSSNLFSGVSAGNHVVTVKDGNNCTTTRNFTLTQPGILGITASPTAIACYNSTSTVTLSGSGGTTPYTFRVDGGTQQSSGVFPGIVAATHTFTVIDAFGALKDTIITITQPSQISISVSTGTILINGGNTTVTVTASGGTGSLTYSIDGGSYQGSNSFAGILAGSHTISVKDANNCTNTNTFSISQPGQLIITISRGAAISCYGGTQTITIAATGGTTPYTVTGGSPQSKLAGTYTFTITDAFGAIADTIITVTEPTQISISVSTGTIVVNGGTTTATITASGGTGSLQYSLDGGSYQGSNAFAGVSAGNHSVTVKDANNCTNFFPFFISQPGILYITATPSGSILCQGGSVNVVVTASGGTLPITGTGTFSQTAGSTTYTVTDALGASHDTIITLSEPLAVITDSVNAGTIAIYGGTTTIITHSTGGTRPFTFKLDGGSFQSDSTFTGVAAGNHTVTTKDANNCTGTFSFTLTQPPAPSAGFYLKRRRVRHFYYQL